MRSDLRLATALMTCDGSGNPEQLQSGQVSLAEGLWLRQAARGVPVGQVIVEVGSYTGKSTSCLARGSSEGWRVPVYAVDLWTVGTSDAGRNFRVRRLAEPVDESKFHMPEVLEVFRRRMDIYGADLVFECMGASVDVAATFPHRTVGLLFIDAEHSYDACRADFEAWSPKVEPGGIIALHDYKEGLGAGACAVMRYVDEVTQEGRWRIREIVGTLVVLENRLG
jgi:predicted O-methyltransferase YrrM